MNVIFSLCRYQVSNNLLGISSYTLHPREDISSTDSDPHHDEGKADILEGYSLDPVLFTSRLFTLCFTSVFHVSEKVSIDCDSCHSSFYLS